MKHTKRTSRYVIIAGATRYNRRCDAVRAARRVIAVFRTKDVSISHV